MFGSLGGGATWAEGIYEMRTARKNGVWKISKLDYHSGFGAPYASGWGDRTAAAAAPGARRGAARGTARARAVGPSAGPGTQHRCEGFPAACIAPFHYANPGDATARRSGRWPASLAPARRDARPARLARRARKRLADEQQIENLQRIYGYYHDRAQWDQVADLFADNGTHRVRAAGRLRRHASACASSWLTWARRSGARLAQRSHPAAVIVDRGADGRTAWSRSRELSHDRAVGGSGEWSEGIYENRFVKEDGIWKFAACTSTPPSVTDYDQGWGKDAQPAPGIDPDCRQTGRPPRSTRFSRRRTCRRTTTAIR